MDCASGSGSALHVGGGRSEGGRNLEEGASNLTHDTVLHCAIPVREHLTTQGRSHCELRPWSELGGKPRAATSGPSQQVSQAAQEMSRPRTHRTS